MTTPLLSSRAVSPWLWIAWLALALSGCRFDLDVEGKRCDSAHLCPEGYFCVEAGGEFTCQHEATDGGHDGGDGGDTGPCQEDEKRCTPALDGVEVCDAYGRWQLTTCSGGQYCLVGYSAGPTCVPPCASSGECPVDTYCNLANGHCEAMGNCTNPGVPRCNLDFTAVIACNADSGWDEVVEECSGEGAYCDMFDITCKTPCDDDSTCASWPDTSCDPSSRKCLPMNLCADEADCTGIPGGLCLAGACIAPPLLEAEVEIGAGTFGPASLDCFNGTPTEPPASPTSCTLNGAVADFVNPALTAGPIGLTLRLHHLEDVLGGDLNQAIASVQAVDQDGAAHYTFANAPTNIQLVLEVQGRAGEYASVFTFGLYLRADDCTASSGTLDMLAPTLTQTLFNTYSNWPPAGITADARRGLLFGWLRDCNSDSILYGTAGASHDNDVLFYVPPGQPPAEPFTETTKKGMVCAANALAIRGQIGALVLASDGQTIVPVGAQAVRVFPASVSLVLLGPPKAPE